MTEKQAYKEKIKAQVEKLQMQFNKLVKGAEGAIGDLKKTMEKRDVYVKKIEEQLKQLNVQIDKLAAAADKAKENAKAEYYKQIKLLREKQKLVNDKLQEIKKSSADAWVDIKAGIDKSAQEFKKAMSQAISRFK